MSDKIYEQFLAGCSAPTGGGSIETRNTVLTAHDIRNRVEACHREIAETSHPFIGADSSDPAAFLIALYACSKSGRICVHHGRAKKDPVEQGGWNIFLTAWVGADIMNPLTSAPLGGQGEKGF